MANKLKKPICGSTKIWHGLPVEHNIPSVSAVNVEPATKIMAAERRNFRLAMMKSFLAMAANVPTIARGLHTGNLFDRDFN